MSSPSTDPQPEDTTGLDDGASVQPGDTPPGEASTTQGVSRKQPDLPSSGANKLVYGIVIGVVLLTALLFAGYAAGLIG